MPEPRKKKLSLPIAGALLMLIVGRIAKIQHWPFGSSVYMTGLILVGCLYFLRYTLKADKNLKDIAKMLMVLTWVLVNFLALYKFVELQYVIIIGAISGLGWLINEIVDFGDHKARQDRLNAILWIGILLVVTSVIFKIQRLPLSSIFLLFGLLFSAIGFIIDYIWANKRNVHNSTYAPSHNDIIDQ